MWAPINIKLVRVRLAISVVQEHGIVIGHIVFAPATLPWLKLSILLC
jgi:hypothetical protein